MCGFTILTYTFTPLRMFACVCHTSLCAYKLHVRFGLGVHRCECMFFLLGLPKTCAGSKWTSVNKLCADCIYLIHMLVNYTAACCPSMSGRRNLFAVAALTELQKVWSQLEWSFSPKILHTVIFFCNQMLLIFSFFHPCISRRNAVSLLALLVNVLSPQCSVAALTHSFI